MAVAKLLLDRGAAVDLTMDAAQIAAAQFNHVAVAKLLLARGAAVDQARGDGVTPLFIVV